MEPSGSTSASNRPQGEGDSDHSEAEEERLHEGGLENQEVPRSHETDNLPVSWASSAFDAAAAAAATRVAGELSSTSPERRSGNGGTSAPGRTPDASQSSSTSREHGGERDDGGGNRERLSRATERQVVTYEDLGIFTQQPKRPDLAVTQIRINTFDQWPHQDSHPADQMAEAGFYYTGHQDLVCCFFCKGGLKTWERSDQPWVEHCRWFPRCPFVRLAKGQRFVDVVQTLNSAANQPTISEQQVIDEVNRLNREERRQGGLEDQEAPRPPYTDNLAVSLASATFDAAAAESRVELSSASQERRSGNQGERGHGGGNRERSETERQQPKRPDLAEVRRRTNTFQAWPHQNTHPADQVADAGFYYTGHSDLVRCFHCGGGLKRWRREANPWVEHKRFFPHCSFIREKCQGQAPQSEDDIDESDRALRQDLRTPVQESRGEAGTECDHPALIRPESLQATQYEWSENGLAVSGSPPIMVSSAQAEPALGVVDPDQAAAVPLAGRLVLSEGGLWASGDPPVQEEAARCLHCGEKERELLQDCGHKCLCRHCFFCPYFWNRHLNANQGVMVCLECGRPFHSLSLSSMDQLAAGRLTARRRRFTCSCLSRRG